MVRVALADLSMSEAQAIEPELMDRPDVLLDRCAELAAAMQVPGVPEPEGSTSEDLSSNVLRSAACSR